MQTYTPPTISTAFDHRIRDAWIHVEASAWHDSTGIYKTRIDGIYLDGAEVSALLTDYDIADIYAAIEPAISADQDDKRVTGDIPGPFPTL